ncbi:recombinase family protein [Erysipelothrix rhusiopathiae]|nr:recombinase family protein [Erysipelothrix rhusiopathiae]
MILPFGYKFNNGVIIIDGNNSVVIKDIFQMRLKGKSLNSIADYLNDKGILKRNGKQWYHHDIGKILRNSKYYGDREFPKIIINKIFSEVQLTFKEKEYHYEDDALLVQDGCTGKVMKLYSGVWMTPARRNQESSEESEIIFDNILKKEMETLVIRLRDKPNILILTLPEIFKNTKIKTNNEVLDRIVGKVEDKDVVRELLNRSQNEYDQIDASIRIDLNKRIIRLIKQNNSTDEIPRRIIKKIIVKSDEIEFHLISNQIIKIQYVQERE